MTIRLMPIESQIWKDPSDPQIFTLDSGIQLSYPKHLEGGCFWLKDEFVSVIKKINKAPYNHCFEWCSGLGGIGFEILGSKLCNKITFSDYYNVAIENCLDNAKANNLSDVVTGYVSSRIDQIPTNELWDLVVGTPPHCFNGDEYLEHLSKTNTDACGSLTASNWARLTIDDGMEIHKEFFQNIRQHLSSNSDVLLFGSSVQEFIIELAIKGNLKLIDTYPVKRYGVIYHFRPSNYD